MSTQSCAQPIFCTMMYFDNIYNLQYVKISAVHITALTLDFILFFSKNLAVTWLFSRLPQPKSAHISERQNTHMLWVFIFLVR